jgi:hypothetical protein
LVKASIVKPEMTDRRRAYRRKGNSVTQPLDFGGHPMLHRYNYLMSQQRLADLQCETERERLARVVERHSDAQKFYYRWARQFGEQIIRWGQSLLRYGTTARSTDNSSPNPVEAAKDFPSLKVVHASPMRRAKWN